VDLDGKVAIVTGASRGVGAATAIALGAAGARVACAARATDAQPLPLPGTIDGTVRAIRDAGGDAIAVPTNLAADDEVEAMVTTTEAHFGRVDILVNNAAITFPGDVDLPMKRYDLIFAVNTRAPLIAVQTALTGMRARGEGAILNVSSLAALNYFPTQMAYGMSKIALEHMTVSLATQLLGDRIPVNTFRIDVPVASEGFVYNSPGVDISDWEPTDVAAEGILWMLRQPPEYTGHNVGMAALRDEQGIMASASARRHRHLDRINRVNPMPVNPMSFPLPAGE
jgi:NAD(P)-dependent dehydrogenase (short-subunit alcohol dehydrogenase family)